MHCGGYKAGRFVEGDGMSQRVIFPAPSAGGKQRDYGWEFENDYRVALQIKNGTADPSTLAQTLGPKLTREALDRRLAEGQDEADAPYFYTLTENYNPSDPREIDFEAWYGPTAASGGEAWGATGWYKANHEQPVVEVMPNGVLLGCAWRGDVEGCRTALTYRANPNFRDGSTSVLSAALEARSLTIVELLIAEGLNPDQGRDVGWLIKPLVETGERALLERLLSFLRPPEDHWTQLLGVTADAAIAELLEAHGASVQTAVNAGYSPLIEMLKIDPNRSRPERLDRAGELVRWLVTRGADVNAVAQYSGETALSLAVWYWEVPAIRALLLHGADPDLPIGSRSARKIAEEAGRLEDYNALVAECRKPIPPLSIPVEPVQYTEPANTIPAQECDTTTRTLSEEETHKTAVFAWPKAIGGLLLIAGLAVATGAWPPASSGAHQLIAWAAILGGIFLLFRAFRNTSLDREQEGETEALAMPVAARSAQQTGGSITADDYPAAALRDDASGRCVLQFTVSETGAVRDIEISVSSGHKALDDAACKLIARRFRFEPARDAAGRPIAERRQQAVQWELSEAFGEEPTSAPDSVHPSTETVAALEQNPLGQDASNPFENEVPWHVLSSTKTVMEVFRMTDEERTIMNLVRLCSGDVQLLYAALDGPSWIYSPPPPMGITEDGVSLWEPEARATVDSSLKDLPEWAENDRSRIIAYLSER
jgi:TonB family protein